VIHNHDKIKRLQTLLNPSISPLLTKDLIRDTFVDCNSNYDETLEKLKELVPQGIFNFLFFSFLFLFLLLYFSFFFFPSSSFISFSFSFIYFILTFFFPSPTFYFIFLITR
jgi:hypothetical protein